MPIMICIARLQSGIAIPAAAAGPTQRNAKGYKIWAEAIVDQVAKLLREK